MNITLATAGTRAATSGATTKPAEDKKAVGTVVSPPADSPPVAITSTAPVASDVLSGSVNEVKPITGIDTSYLDVANQQANAPTTAIDPNKLATDVASGVNIKEAKDYITPEMMVEDRFNRIMDSQNDSLFMKKVRASAAGAANRAGLLSTDKGQGAIYGAAADAAINLAKQDAATEAKFGLQQQSTEGNTEQTKTQGIVSGALNAQEQAHKNISGAFATTVRGLDQELSAELQKQSKDLELMINNNQIDAAIADSVRKESSAIIQNNQIAVEKLLGNTEFIGLGGPAVTNILNQMARMTAGSIQYQTASAGVNTAAQNQYQNDLIKNMSFNFSNTSIPAV